MSLSLHQRSLELCVFFKSKLPVVQQCPLFWFCVCHYVSSLSLAVWSVFTLIHVSFKDKMINMWLQVGSREASDGWEWHLMDGLSHLLVWSICWAFLCVVSWQMERFVQRHIRFGAGPSNCRLEHFAILCIYHSMDKLDKPVSYKVGVVLFSLIFPAC